MILETALILGGAVGLIAIQPPLRKLFPEREKPTVWEEFWDKEAVKQRWRGVPYNGLPDSLIEKCASCGEAVGKCRGKCKERSICFQPFTTSKAVETLKTSYVPVMQKQLDMSAQLFEKVKEADRAKAEFERSQQSMDSSSMGRRAFSEKAQRLGMQVYLDHETNQYRMRETQLSKNLAALKAATNSWEHETQGPDGRPRWRFGTQLESRPWISEEQLRNATTYEELYKLVAPDYWDYQRPVFLSNLPRVTVTPNPQLTVDGVMGEPGGAWPDEKILADIALEDLKNKIMNLLKADGR